ncbi:hypothetical protein ACJVC5_14630 [Peredibacter sp. HCB2-198]|uniref:hypothetical protein n=1 Tax=Peredibacter sp. HCB2-198 TaxID=3383025 RepID=UPI0038B6118B
MKMLLIALALVSGSAFAQEMDATEALTSVLPVGNYSGRFANERCSVTVREEANGVRVSATNGRYTRSRLVEFGSVYRLWGTTQFLSSTSYSTNDGFNENLVRTRADVTGKQYVVVADRVVVMNEQFEHKVECIVNFRRN